MATLQDHPARPEDAYPSPPKDTRDAQHPSSAKHGTLSPTKDLVEPVPTGEASADIDGTSERTLVDSALEREVVETVLVSAVELSESNRIRDAGDKTSPGGSVPENISSITLSSVSATEVVASKKVSLEESPVSPSRPAGQQPMTENTKPKKPNYVVKLSNVQQVKGKDGSIKSTIRTDTPSGDRAGEDIPILELVTIKEEMEDDSTTMLKILSPMIINVLRAVVSSTDVNLDGNTVQLRSPYQLLYSHEEQLRAYQDAHPETHSAEYREECNRHLAFLLKFLADQESISRGLRIERSRWKRPTPLATFKNLWLLLKPGDLVFEKLNDHLDPYIISTIEGGMNRVVSPYKISLWHMDSDGTHFGRSVHQTTINPFEGEVEITKLKVYPAEYHPEHEKKRQELMDRGRKWFQTVKGISYKEYTGASLEWHKRKLNRARLVVDYASVPWNTPTWETEVPRPNLGNLPPNTTAGTACWCEFCEAAYQKDARNQRPQYDGWDSMRFKEQKELTDDQYLLCPGQFCGWVLKERFWHMLDINHVSDPNFDEGIMDNLVMDEKKKRMIQAICQKFTDVNPSSHTDIIHGKGEGRIFLLHGSPGVGKTLTAGVLECVAEYTRRPLMTITSGDIGIDAKTVEEKLEQYFNWAEEWRAILLLDEADIYLERRSRQDLKRNSVVSVFLRSLEYYQGVLFITTNRVGAFDEAFRSRVHISLFYKPFDAAMREQIWEQHFERWVEASKNTVKVTDGVRFYVKSHEELLKLKLNGREIRNAFQTAVTLAEFDALEGEKKVELKRDHLDQVVKMSQAFDQYLTNAHSATDSQIAALSGYRADDFDETVGKIAAHAVRELKEVAQQRLMEKGNGGYDTGKGS
ncbi:MAG: hypothetical protein M1823_001868 [Watsoniomyces obsoletus]|nr:MAG: hypothetical protein M1823_001868 [Watsoniomyces obsoletus]